MKKMYMCFDTGFFWTEEEIREGYDGDYDLQNDYPTFEEFFEHLLDLGKQKIGGLVEVDHLYIVCDEGRNGWGDIFISEFLDKDDAIEEAEYQWYHLTDAEKKQRKIYVIESKNPDPDAADHLDGDYVWRCDQ